MAELVDAYVSGAYIERCAGSTPVRGTLNIETLSDNQSVRVFLFQNFPTRVNHVSTDFLALDDVLFQKKLIVCLLPVNQYYIRQQTTTNDYSRLQTFVQRLGLDRVCIFAG